MINKIFVWLLTTILLASALSAEAQQQSKIPRVGFLRPVESEESHSRHSGRVCASLATLKGKISLWSTARVRPISSSELAAELVGLQVDIILADGTGLSPGCQASNQQDPDCYDDQYRSCRDRAHC